MLNKLEFINSPITLMNIWEKRSVVNTRYYNWTIHNVITNYINTYRKYSIGYMPTWAYYETFQTYEDIYTWNYYQLRTWYVYNQYQKVPTTTTRIYLNSDYPFAYHTSNTGSWALNIWESDGDGNYNPVNTLQLLHTSGYATELPFSTSTDQEIDLTPYYNQGFFAISINNINNPMLFIQPGDKITAEWSILGYVVARFTSKYRVDNWQQISSWGVEDSSKAYSMSAPYLFNSNVGDFIEEIEYTQPINDTGYYETENYVYILARKEYTKANTTIIGTLTSNNASTYPEQGVVEVGEVEYYCEYAGKTSNYGDWVRGDYIGDVSATDPNYYPQDGRQDDYWYVYKGDVEIAGDYIEDVVANDYDTYPENGVMGDYYYVLVQERQEYEKGSQTGTTKSTQRNTYPDDNKMGSMWYVYVGESVVPEAGSFIEEVMSADSGAYPADGIQGDYWFKYNRQENLYEKTFTNANLMGGVNYTFDLSANTDFTIGMVSSAEIKYVVNLPYSEAQWYINQPCIYSVKYANTNEWKQIGIFNITDITKKDKLTCEMVGYDNIIKLDKVVDAYLKTLQFPITLGNVYTGLLNYVGVDYQTQSILNSGYEIDSGFEIEGITGRQVLEWIAECAGGYGYANTEGEVDIKEFGTNTIGLDNSKYAKYSNGCFNTNKIDKLTIQQDEEDLGISVGDGSNVYKIIGNPFLVATGSNTTQLTQAANYIFTSIKNITYSTADITLYQDFGIDVGEYVNIGGNKHLILNKQITNSGVSLSSTGNQSRPVSQGLNSELLMLKGKSNKFIRDLDKTQSTITDLEKGLQSQITQTADSITSYVDNQIDGVNSTIQQTADSLELKIENATGSSSSLQVQLDQINTRITNEVDGLESTITQTANSINSTITSQDGRINSIEQTLDGVVYDNGSGTTIINGDNITTGTISADRINMTGSISWGDLTSDCQSTISSIGSSSSGLTTSDIKTLYGIQYTTIGQSSISSPTINSGILNSAEINTGKLTSPKIYGGKLYVSTTEGDKYFMIGLNNYGNLQVGSPAGSYDDLTMYAENDIRLYPGGMFDDTNPTPGLRLRYDNFVYIDPVAIPNVANKSALYLNTENGLIGLSSSSRRYKRDIELVKEEWLDPNRLYDLDVVQFKWKEGHFADQDYDYSQYDIGLIAEDVAEKYPFAAIHKGDQVESWSERNIIPPMLYLIQEQKKMIDDLNKRIGDLENGVN